MEQSVAYSDNDWPQGTQTLGRGLSIILAVRSGVDTLSELAREIGCTRSTTQRLTSALLQQGWLQLKSMGRYGLGEKLTSLVIEEKISATLLDLAGPVLQSLNEATGEIVHLGMCSGGHVTYVMRLEGYEERSLRTQTGQYLPLARTGAGRALILDEPEAKWAGLYRAAYRHMPSGFGLWVNRMRLYRASDCVFDLEDDEIGVHCVAAPVRDASGRIIAAVSVTGSSEKLSVVHMKVLAPRVRHAASQLSSQLGWHEMSDVAD